MLPTPPGVPPTPPVLPHNFDYVVRPGDSTWKIIENHLDSRHAMTGLGEGARTHMIDAMKDTYAAMTPAELRTLGFPSGDIGILHPGDVLNLSSVLGNPGIIARALANAQHLSPSEITSIIHNNREIATWFTAHPEYLGGKLNDAVIDKILKGTI